MYPDNWPRCTCGDFALDGKVTCGRVECAEIDEAWLENAIVTRPGENIIDKVHAARASDCELFGHLGHRKCARCGAELEP